VNKTLFVRALDYAVNDEMLKQLFSTIGTVVSAKVICETPAGRSKGFGFVEMSNDAEAKAAITKLNDTEQFGRKIMVLLAKPSESRGDTGRGGYEGSNRGNFDGNSHARRRGN
jgi:cold-inducible RNA-binding protein